MAAFAPEIITQIGPLPITNTVIHTLIVDGILIGTALYLSKRIKKRPSGLQAVVEPIIEAIYSLTETIAPTKRVAKAIFPYVTTFFLFILVANFTGLFPGVGTIGFFKDGSEHAAIVNNTYAVTDTSTNDITTDETTAATTDDDHSETEAGTHEATFAPLIRGATSDINVTLALATISAVATHIMSIRFTGIKDYMSRWFSFNPINLYVGLLELISEITKVISLSFRLFGNIFAGEVTLHTISALSAFIAPIPFLLLESIVSLVQALVFSILTLVFMAMLSTPHHVHAESEAHE